MKENIFLFSISFIRAIALCIVKQLLYILIDLVFRDFVELHLQQHSLLNSVTSFETLSVGKVHGIRQNIEIFENSRLDPPVIGPSF